MTKLSAASNSDQIVYADLEHSFAAGLPYADAGDVKVQDLNYWVDADPAGSALAGQASAYGLVHYCLSNRKTFGTAWVPATPSAQTSAVAALVKIMQDPKKLVSDISVQLQKLFTFTGNPESPSK
jgi:hypothetical protein